MFDIEKHLDDKILQLKKLKPTAIFAGILDRRIILAASQLVRFAKIVLLAPEKDIDQFVHLHCPELSDTERDYLLSHIKAVDISEEEELREKFAREYVKISKGKKWELSPDEAREKMKSPAMFAVMATRLGYADMTFGGIMYGPREFFRPALNILKKDGTPFEAGIFLLPEDHTEESYEQNIAVFSDVAVNARMTPARLADIAVGTCKITRALIPEDVLPHINAAIVSYSTKGLDEGPSVDLVRKAADLVPERLEKLIEQNEQNKTIRIDAEVQISCAISREAAVMKLGLAYRSESPIGKCNVVIAPNLDLGNFLYNSYAVRYPNSKKFPVSGGIFNQVVDFSKESTEDDVRLGTKANIFMLLKSKRWKGTPNDYFFPRYKILALNPGSTSTKFAYSEGDIEVFTKEIQHSSEELAPFNVITEQYEFRKDKILGELKKAKIDIRKLDAVVGRGGVIWPVSSGAYTVNDRMKEDLSNCVQGSHASNLGGLIAAEIAEKLHIPSYIIDPVVVDEVPEEYKIVGLKEMKRKIISHALSQIATAKRYGEEHGKFYWEIRVIVAHMGGGISIGAHHKGKYVDVNNALNGEGPFTPERSGTLPVGQLIDMCYSGKYSLAEMKLKNKGKGGLVDLLGTSDFRKVEKWVQEGRKDAEQVFVALGYQVARWICSLIPAFEGEPVDQVLLTGGLARSEPLVELIKSRIAGMNVGLTVYPGENEMVALREGALRVLMGKEQPKEYQGLEESEEQKKDESEKVIIKTS